MRAVVFGGTGMVGQAIVEEGRNRGHEVLVASRREGAGDLVADVTSVDDVKGAADGADVVVISVPPPRTGEPHDDWLAVHAQLAQTPLPARLAMVGGAGSSLLADGTKLLDSAGFPPEYSAEARSADQALSGFRDAAEGVDWVVLSPAPVIGPGERTGRYVCGEDDLVGSSVSTQNYAVALWDELENPSRRRTRFTVADAT